MDSRQRIREVLTETPDSAYWEKKLADGWRPIAVEWEREGPSEVPGPVYVEEVPFGLRVADDCHHLTEDPEEMEALTLMMEMIVNDQPLSPVARELNGKGFRTRTGEEWTRQAVFHLLPRLIEIGPRIFSHADWTERRARLLHAV